MSITLKQLRHDEIHPSSTNTRQTVGDVSDLADSIAGIGLNTPLAVRANDDGYELVSGWRRWTAIGKLIADGRAKPDDTWPVLLRKGAEAADDVAQASTIVENLYREDVTPYEEFTGLARLAGAHGWTAEQIAEATGIPKSTVKGRLKWMVFTDEQLQNLLRSCRVDQVASYAALPQATIDKIFESELTGWDLQRAFSSEVEERRRQRDARRDQSRIRKAGHLVIGLDDKDSDAATDVLAGLVADSGREVAWLWVSSHRLNAELESIVKPSVFKISTGGYHADIKMAYVPAEFDPADAGELSDKEYHQKLVNRWDNTQREIANEMNEQAERTFLQEKPSALVAFLCEHAIAQMTDHEGKPQKRIVDKVIDRLGLDSDVDIFEYAHKNGTQLARVAAAVLLVDSYSASVPGYEEQSHGWTHLPHELYREDGSFGMPALTQPDDETDEEFSARQAKVLEKYDNWKIFIEGLIGEAS